MPSASAGTAPTMAQSLSDSVSLTVGISIIQCELMHPVWCAFAPDTYTPRSSRSTTLVNRSGSACSDGPLLRSPLGSVMAPPITRFSRWTIFTNSKKRLW